MDTVWLRLKYEYDVAGDLHYQVDGVYGSLEVAEVGDLPFFPNLCPGRWYVVVPYEVHR